MEVSGWCEVGVPAVTPLVERAMRRRMGLEEQGRQNAMGQAVTPALEAASYVYHRLGRDFRVMTFGADGRIGEGAQADATHWQWQAGRTGPELVLLAQGEPAAVLRAAWDGSWRGKTLSGELRHVELTPQPARLGRAPVCAGHPRLLSQTMPRVIHQIWLGSKPLGVREQEWMRTWRSMNPGWEYRLWTDDEAQGLELSCRRLFDRVRNMGMKADLLRYEILHRFGGLYADTDFECLRPMEPLLDEVDADCFAGLEWPTVSYRWSICNALIGARPGAGFLARILGRVEANALRYEREARWHGGECIPRSTGPAFLTRCAAGHDDLTVFPQPVLYPRVDEAGEAYARHHFRGSWKE